MTKAYIWKTETPEGTFLGGVPARDLEEAEVRVMPRYLRRSIAVSTLYTPTSVGLDINAEDQTAIEQEYGLIDIAPEPEQPVTKPRRRPAIDPLINE